MRPAWPSTAGGAKPGRSVTYSSASAGPSASTAGTQPEPSTIATSCDSTPVSRLSTSAARRASSSASESGGASGGVGCGSGGSSGTVGTVTDRETSTATVQPLMPGQWLVCASVVSYN